MFSDWMTVMSPFYIYLQKLTLVKGEDKVGL